VQEAYEIRKAKLDRTNEELLHELSSSPEINSTMSKMKIYNILSKGFLFEDDKPVLSSSLMLFQYAYNFFFCYLTCFIQMNKSLVTINGVGNRLWMATWGSFTAVVEMCGL